MKHPNNKTVNFIDLFAGIGGFRIALEKAGAKCVFSSEIDKWACETYNRNFGEIPSGDITKISTSKIPDHDILCAGFPCQSFSIGGYRKGFDDVRGTMFFEVARILKGKKPLAFILENVRGILNHDKGNTVKTIRDILNSLDYDFFESIINAKDQGLPQNRERWFCVGFKKEMKVTNFEFPKKKALRKTVYDLLEQNVEGHEMTKIAAMHVKNHYAQFASKANTMTIASEIRPSRCVMKNNGISPCLTAKMGTGGNNVPVIVELERKFTVRECLRLMGFPEHYKIKRDYHQSYKQIGNSIPVPVAENIARQVLKEIKHPLLQC